VSDLTLISKVSNEAINDNLKKRFENAEIYVRLRVCALTDTLLKVNGLTDLDVHRARAGIREPI
jgi:myosin I